MIKLSKNKAIELILDELKKGTPKVNILAINGNKWHIARRTFERYYKEAEIKYINIQKEVEKDKLKEYTQAELDRLRTTYLDREKVLKMSSNVLKIAYKNATKNKDDKSIYAFTTAQSTYSKLQGFDAPTKIANTDKDGEDVKQIIKLPNGTTINLS